MKLQLNDKLYINMNIILNYSELFNQILSVYTQPISIQNYILVNNLLSDLLKSTKGIIVSEVYYIFILLFNRY